MVLVRELMDRQQLHRGHAQLHQVLDRGRVRETGVRPAQLLGDPGMQLGEPPDVHLVDDRVRPRSLRPPVVRPVVVIVHHDTLRDVRRRVPVVPDGVRDLLLRPVPDMAVHLRRQPEVAVHRAGVRVEEQLGRVPAGAGPGVPAAVHPVAVALARQHPGHETVPDLVRQLGQPGPGLLARLVEQTQLDRLRPARPQREVGAGHPVRADPETGAQRRRRARPHGHAGRPARGSVQYGSRNLGGTLLSHRLTLGCAAGHLGPPTALGTACERACQNPGSGSPSRRPPHCSAQRLARTHVSPERAPSLGTS